MLHIVNHSRSESTAFCDCLDSVVAGDAVLLIENAVYLARDGASAGSAFEKPGVRLFALGDDLQARGVLPDQVAGIIQIIDYEGFVDLVEAHSPIQSWF